MILFWLAALVLIAVALAFVLPPLLGAGRAATSVAGDTSPSLELYRSRLAALEEQHRIGALSDADLAQARDELGRELLADTEAAAPAEKSTGPRVARPWLAVAVGVAVPLLSIALYQHLGAPGAVDAPAAVADAGAGAGADAGAGAGDVERMVAGLAERLASEPGNSEGWLLLARSYMVLERYAEAARAYAAAHRLLGDSAELLSDLAEAEALRDRQNFLGVSGERLERALVLDPEHPKALWLGAFAAMQRGETELAVSRWQALLERQPADSEAARVLSGLIAGTGGAEPATAAPAEETGAAGAAVLTVNVIVADRLAAGLDGSETLFVFARAADGPPMPLAVTRRRTRDLPLTVTLDDSMAMAPGRKLSDFERVVVGARIAMNGTPTASSGDLQGFSEPVTLGGDTAIDVAITERVP
jgi:cytochrome c-type biogenesis protein CcmH